MNIALGFANIVVTFSLVVLIEKLFKCRYIATPWVCYYKADLL